MTSTPGRPTGEAVLARALRLFDAFVDEEPATLTDLAERSGLPKPTALRLARILVTGGLLERRGDGRYQLGLRLFELASLAPRGHGLREIAQPFLGDLHAATRLPVLLVVRDGLHTVLVERLVSHGDLVREFRVGRRYPLHSSAAGRVLLAHAPREVQEEILARDLVYGPTGAPISSTELRATLADVRAVGWCTYRSDLAVPILGVGAPIHGPGREVMGAVSVASADDPAPMSEMRTALLTVTRAITRDLGGLPHVLMPPTTAS